MSMASFSLGKVDDECLRSSSSKQSCSGEHVTMKHCTNLCRPCLEIDWAKFTPACACGRMLMVLMEIGHSKRLVGPYDKTKKSRLLFSSR